MTFDPSISWGNLLTIGFGCLALALAWGKLGSRLDLMEFRVKAIEDTLKVLADAMKALVKNEADIVLLRTQLVAVEVDLATTNRILESLRRGEGFIQSRPNRNDPNRGVDREYP